MIVASYTRKSVKFGDSISIADQNTAIEEFLKKYHMSVCKKYSDRKESVEAEEGFLQMKEDGINRKYDCVVFWSIMYFGKDPLNGYNLLRHVFLPSGINFAIACDDFISIGKTSDEIVAFLDKKYKERRAAHSIKAADFARKQRTNTLYGYRIVDDVFVIDDNARPVVDQIFSMALAGDSPSVICKRLNVQGIEPPQIYLRKDAGKTVEGLCNSWQIGAVKKILTDSRYKGVRKVLNKGEITYVPFPSYINSEQYERVNLISVNPPVKRSERWNNPLAKKVFDKDTMAKMYSGDYIGDGKRYFFISKLTDISRGYKKKVILAEDLLDQVRTYLLHEHRVALNVQRLMNSDEQKNAVEAAVYEYKKEIGDLFEKMLIAVDSGDISDFKSLDARFGELQSTIDFYQKAFSMENPWLNLYLKIPDDIEISKENSKKYIDRVLVCKNESVEICPYSLDYKNALPETWLRAENING